MKNWDIITVTYNSEEQIQRNWKWFFNHRNQINWIVVDNGSSDNSVRVARSLGARVMPLGENIGFSKANNIAVKDSESEFILFANPDLAVKQEDLERLEKTLRLYPGICSPQLLNLDSSPQKNARGVPYLTAKMAHRGFPFLKSLSTSRQYIADVEDNKVTKVRWLMGASVATERQVFQKIGLWDENYFIYYEDHDLGLRSTALGFNVTVDSTLKWKHEWARETKKLNLRAWKYELKSAFYFYLHHPSCLR
jgi:N-acetylglucosaminyl-diphospho-decaprenol L-rhamnosyltransferase